MTITGSIETIEYSNVRGHEKKLLTICKYPKPFFISNNNKIEKNERIIVQVNQDETLVCNISGTVQEIEDRLIGEYMHTVVTLIPDHRQKAMIEFRGKRKSLLNGFKEGEEVTVEVFVECKVSNSTGTIYNNLIGNEIHRKINV